ncbi:MAG: FtsX-like permease family protein [Candidatus Schekmanbacteria bacterium]|nr:FtsX-like permease family protein [Candidatus Schekmanbacteria bacterium]
MTALDKKLLRDLWDIRSQALAIALVIASGVATSVMSLTALDSLRVSRDTYYRENRFPDVFASLQRAPSSVARRLAEIPGVDHVEARVVSPAKIELSGYEEPIIAALVSVPVDRLPGVDRLFIRRGRPVDVGRLDQIVVSDAFAGIHGLSPGDRLGIIVNGRRRMLTISGVGASPEHIYQIAPGSVFPDFEAFAIVWMARETLAAALDLEGSFNDVALAVRPGASVAEILAQVDEILAPYGGLGAYDRGNQLSHRYLSEELRQLRQMATMFPAIFLAVATFLLNVVANRLVGTQKEQIAVLKAFGYSTGAIGWHYLKIVLAIAVLGILAGTALGAQLGKELGELYMRFYKLPYLVLVISGPMVLTAGGLSALAVALGTAMAVRRAALMAPAEAMRPEPPARYRTTVLERLGFGAWLSPASRMIARDLERRPAKTALSIVGVALAGGILMMGTIFDDSFAALVEIEFRLAQRDDIAVTFVEPRGIEVLSELRHLPGVLRVEPLRAVPVRLRAGHRSYRTQLEGVNPAAELRRLLDHRHRPLDPPATGVMLDDFLGGYLGVRPGDTITVEELTGRRRTRTVAVAALVRRYLGVGAYMEISALNRHLGEGIVFSGAALAVDAREKDAVYAALRSRPGVAGVVVRDAAVARVRETMGNNMIVFAIFASLFAATIAFGVVYNYARISLAERSRELASLRVLGFTRREISAILLGELGVVVLAAIPLALVIGRALCAVMMVGLQTDIVRIPVVVDRDSYAYATAIILASTALSALVARRRLHELDLIGVLKTRE